MTSTPVPHSGCYWVVPGKFLAGNYPGEKEVAKARLKLGGILDHGVRTFINLMQPEDRNHSGLPFTPYADIADTLASEQGFTVTHQTFPIQDQGIPDTKTMDAVLEFIDASLRQDRPIYLHCWGGHGRTGTVVGCYLIAHGLATKDNFVEVIAQLRKHVPTHIPSPENSKQRDFVRAYDAPRVSAPDNVETDRFLGCLLGLAVGDAVGTTLEFKAPGSFKPIDDMVGGGPFGLEPGQWTDDTSMALCLAESLIECRGFDPIDQLTRYRRWYKEGYLSAKGHCFDIGNATRSALDEFGRTGEAWCGSTSPNSAGNGSLMRLAPIPMAFASQPHEMLQHAADSSRTTHGATEAVDACRYYAGLLLGGLSGESKETLLAPFYCPIPNYWEQNPLAPKIHEVAAGSFLTKEPPQIKGSGYVVQALEAALWAFHKSTNYRDGCLLAANLGDDADTTAAIYGQIAGACYGAQGIPTEWREKVWMRELIEDYAGRLYAMSRLGH
jgi:ADP-ribosylglycohydrolase